MMGKYITYMELGVI